jgi:hypothetical protein
MRGMITVVSALLLALALSSDLLASDLKDRREFGAGIVLGEPSGLNGQFFWSSNTAIDVTAAWSWRDWFMTAADFQVYNYIWDAPREWTWYYGLGAYLALPENESGTLGVRVPVGLKYSFPHSYLDVWAEVDPALQLIKDTEAELHGGIGVTFWFH